MGIFIKHHMVCIETVELCSTQAALASQLKEGENDQMQIDYWEATLEVLKVEDTHPTHAEGS